MSEIGRIDRTSIIQNNNKPNQEGRQPKNPDKQDKKEQPKDDLRDIGKGIYLDVTI